MGEKVQIARQDTLLEVKTTGVQTQNTLDEVNGKIGNFGDTAEEGTLFGQMAGGSGSSGAVKSKQTIIINSDKPTGQDSSLGYASYKDYTISSVNLDKSIILPFSAKKSSSDDNSVCARFIDEKTVRVYASYTAMGIVLSGICVQIVEFL